VRATSETIGSSSGCLSKTASFDREALGPILVRHGRKPHALVQILREAQAQHTWLPREMLAWLAAELGLTLAHVEGVATFYRFFHTEPVGEYRVLFSDNITDRMLGSADLLADLCKRLGVERGQVRADGRVSVDFCSCTGLCDQGPALLINYWQIVTRLDAGRVAQIARLIESRLPVAECEMTISNLRGRGGAGFVTAKKWELCRAAAGSEHCC
jgi:[NiFe] hydrogenase diaphorase moiety large subunit